MLSVSRVLPERASRLSASACIDHLIERWLSGRAEATTGERRERSRQRIVTHGVHGFSWQAPIYEAPSALKDILSMHNPVRANSASSQKAEAFRWRRHPVLLKAQSEPSMPEGEREARKAAVCGVLAAHAGDLDEAAMFFARAATEPSIRFQVVPGFWSCTRGGMDAAVAAYEAAGRFRDAAALAATIRTRYRPRPVGTRGQGTDVAPADWRSLRGEHAAGTGD